MILAFLLVLSLCIGMISACGTSETTPETTDSEGDDNVTTKVTTTARQAYEEPQDDDDGDDDDEGEELIEKYAFPNAHAGNLALEGYDAWGEFRDGEVYTGPAMFIVTNDEMSAGKLSCTLTGVVNSPSDSGIVFCVEPDVNEDIWFFEGGPAYYMLFASDGCTLYLSKVSFNGAPWTVLANVAIPGFQHGDEITITAEFDGQGNIKGYANGELLIDYTDSMPLEGSGYGVRGEIRGVSYSDVTAEHAE